MRTIHVFEFNELNEEAKLRAVNNNIVRIINESQRYLDEIFEEYVCTFVETMFKGSIVEEYKINVSRAIANVVCDISKHMQRGDEARALLEENAKELADTCYWFVSDFAEYVKSYDDSMTYYEFVMNFISAAVHAAATWLVKMRDPFYAREYISNRVDDKECYADSSVYFDECEFYADGSRYKM